MIQFTYPQEIDKQETKLEFTNDVYKRVDEELPQDEVPQQEVHKETHNSFVPGGVVKNSIHNIYVKLKEGEPFLLKEQENANKYPQLKVYEDASSIIYEDNLNNDYKNNEELKRLKELYPDDYLKIAKGEVNEK